MPRCRTYFFPRESDGGAESGGGIRASRGRSSPFIADASEEICRDVCASLILGYPVCMCVETL